MLYYMSVKSKSKKMRNKSKSFQKRKHTRQTRKRSQSRKKRVRFNLKGGCGCEMTGGKKQGQRGGTDLMPQDLTNMGRVGVHDVTTTWNAIGGISNVHNPSPLPEVQGPLQL
jgi:hypothetical protein